MDTKAEPIFVKPVLDTETSCKHAFKYSLYADLDGRKCELELCETCLCRAIAGDHDHILMFAMSPMNMRILLVSILEKMRNDKTKTAH
jgi:hypothetical protein